MKNIYKKLTKLATTPLDWLKVSCLLAVFLSFPLGQLARISVGSGFLYAHELPLTVFVLLSTRSIWSWLSNIPRSLWTKSNWRSLRSIITSRAANKTVLFVVLLLWICLGMISAQVREPNLQPLLYLARIGMYLGFLVGVFKFVKEASAHEIAQVRAETLHVALILSGVWYWWLALVQYLFLPDTRFLWLFGWDDHYYRMIGTLFDPGLTGILCILCLIAVLMWHRKLPVLVSTGVVIACTAGLVLTYSRAAYISGALGLLLLFYRNMSGKIAVKSAAQLAAVGVIIASIIYLSAPKPGGEGVDLLRTSTITARWQTTQLELSQVVGWQWWIGNGLFSQSAASKDTHRNNNPDKSSVITAAVSATSPSLPTQQNKATVPDNLLVTLLTQTGVIGLLLVLTLIVKIMKSWWSEHTYIFIAASAVLMQSQFNNTLLHPYIIFYLGMLVVSDYLRVTLRSSST